MGRAGRHMLQHGYRPWSWGKKSWAGKATKKREPVAPMPKVRPPIRGMPTGVTGGLKKVNRDSGGLFHPAILGCLRLGTLAFFVGGLACPVPGLPCRATGAWEETFAWLSFMSQGGHAQGNGVQGRGAPRRA